MSKFIGWAAALALAACVTPQQGPGQGHHGQGQPEYGQADQSGAQQAPPAAGTYLATTDDGQQMQLVLSPDGSVSLGGETGQWVQEGAQVAVVGDDGTPLYGVLSGDQLVFDLGGVHLAFVRAGGAAGGAAGPDGEGTVAGAPGGQAHDDSGAGYDQQVVEGDTGAADRGQGVGGKRGGADTRPTTAAGKPFSPERTLRGSRVRPEGTSYSITVPSGWEHSWQQGDDGTRVYTLVAPDTAGRGAILIRQAPAGSDEAGLPLATLLQRALPELIGNTHPQTVLAPETFSVEGNEAGRMIVTVPAPNGQPLEIYLSAVRAEGWHHAVIGLYDAALGDRYRPGVETVLASFRGGAPRTDPGLAQQVIGCWELYEGSTDSSGSASFTRRIQLAGDGTFAYRSSSSVGIAGASALSDTRDHGTWYAVSDTIYATGEDGEVSTYTVRREGGMLYLNGKRYLPCQ